MVVKNLETEIIDAGRDFACISNHGLGWSQTKDSKNIRYSLICLGLYKY
jgi:hypothetical protein